MITQSIHFSPKTVRAEARSYCCPKTLHSASPTAGQQTFQNQPSKTKAFLVLILIFEIQKRKTF